MTDSDLRKAINVAEDSSEKEQEKEKTPAIKVTLNRTPFDVFRYLLTGMLVTVKLGLLSYLSVNPLATVSWWLVFLPAYILEAVLLAFVVGVGVTLVLILLVYVFWLTFHYLVVEPIQKRRFKKKVEDAAKTGQFTGDPPVDLMMSLRNLMGSGSIPEDPPSSLDDLIK